MSYSADADEAIEQWALARRPAVSEHRWHHRKPAADWHYTKIHWEAEMDLIQENFERRIGFTISLSPREKRKSADLIMDDIAYVLVRRAELASGNTVLKALR